MTPTKRNLENELMIAAVVLEHYLSKGEDSSADEIAAMLGWSTSKVRKTITDASGRIEGLQVRATNHQFRTPAKYGPSRMMLRDRILSLRGDMDARKEVLRRLWTQTSEGNAPCGEPTREEVRLELSKGKAL